MAFSIFKIATSLGNRLHRLAHFVERPARTDRTLAATLVRLVRTKLSATSTCTLSLFPLPAHTHTNQTKLAAAQLSQLAEVMEAGACVGHQVTRGGGGHRGGHGQWARSRPQQLELLCQLTSISRLSSLIISPASATIANKDDTMKTIDGEMTDLLH